MSATSPLADELRQSLTAAINYLNAARLLLESLDVAAARLAQENLERAEGQLLRAGEISRFLSEDPPGTS